LEQFFFGLDVIPANKLTASVPDFTAVKSLHCFDAVKQLTTGHHRLLIRQLTRVHDGDLYTCTTPRVDSDVMYRDVTYHNIIT